MNKKQQTNQASAEYKRGWDGTTVVLVCFWKCFMYPQLPTVTKSTQIQIILKVFLTSAFFLVFKSKTFCFFPGF